MTLETRRSAEHHTLAAHHHEHAARHHHEAGNISRMTIMHMPRIKRKSRTPILAVPFVTATKLPNIIRNSMGGLRPTAKTRRADPRTRLIGIRESEVQS